MVDANPLTPMVLKERDRDAAADLLTEAVFDNPAHTFIYPEAADRQARLRWLMYANLGAQFAVSAAMDQPAMALAMRRGLD